ncbi:hypothetical protein [Pseudomonas sp. Irchel 3E13]|uniref:hypothetical protein n=1 Tax=Pseudomonas sp. Irchel 3E13 TaxID=2008975 RepID=UPI000BA30AF0|nr:hypothetical protein [Pseudomonas sp. Irchel 3E13]
MTDFNPSPNSITEPADDARELSLPIVDAVLPPIDGGQENLLPITALTAPLNVKFPLWPNSDPSPQQPETLVLLWNGAVVQSKTWTAPIASGDLFIELPKEHLREGIHRLGYRVENWLGNPEESALLTLTIDTTPPVGLQTPAKLVFPMDVIFGGITNRYLEANDNKVEATVPRTSYEYMPGDRLKGFWEEFPYGQNQVIDVELTPDLTVSFDGEMIEREGNGDRAITYLLQDRAGNVSRLSDFEKLNVNILPPEPRPLPTVVEAKPGHPGEGVLDPKNTTSGVTARVPAQQDDISGAALTLHWSGFGAHGSFQTSTASSPDGLDFKIPASAIPANMGRQVEVYYSVKWPTGEPEVSATYLLTVQKLATTTMMLLSCQQAGSGSLSLASTPQGANLSMAPWPYKPLTDGMRINLWVTGLDKQNQAIRFDLLKGQVVPKNASPVTAVLPRADLLKLQVNKVFATRVAVSFDDGESYLDFRPLDLNLVN